MSAITIPPGAFVSANSAKAASPAPAPQAQSQSKPEPVDPPKTVIRKPEKDQPTEFVDKEKAPEKKVWKLKVDEDEFEYDASDEERIKRDLMKAMGADRKFQTAAQMRKDAERFFELLKDKNNANRLRKDPNMGQHLRELAEEITWLDLQERNMSPEERAQAEREAEYESLKRQNEEYQNQQKEHEERQNQQLYMQEYEKEMIRALEANEIPKDPGLISHAASLMLRAAEQGIKMELAEAARLVEQQAVDYSKYYFSKLPPEKLAKLLGEETLNRIRQFDFDTVGNQKREIVRGVQHYESKPQETPKTTPLDWRKSKNLFDDFARWKAS